jgi:DMSO/TMAO reductase YedYZ molybdopterin-dependent catalytic subunit/nitrite reductase/ring-hydroxylating ferredoxin subunit
MQQPRSKQMGGKGYTDYPNRIPPGWRVNVVERWPINNPNSGVRAGFDVGKWRFKTYGEVENPLELTYEQFQMLPHVSKKLDHHCIDGWSYLGQEWSGVDISVIKEMSRIRSSARYLLIESDRAASQMFPIEQDLLLADSQNGLKLSNASGFPLRIVAPGEFGYKSRKWIDRIKFCSAPEMDGLESRFMKVGEFELYSEKIRGFDPWTVDHGARKKFLRTIFAADTEEKRQAKKREHLSSSNVRNIRPKTEVEFKLCTLSELNQSSDRLKLVVNGSEILLIKCGNVIYAAEPICSHMGTDLSRGRINGDARTLKCPLHGALFDVATGSCLSGSYGCDGDAFPSIRTYRIRVTQDDVFLERNQEWGPIW